MLKELKGNLHVSIAGMKDQCDKHHREGFFKKVMGIFEASTASTVNNLAKSIV